MSAPLRWGILGSGRIARQWVEGLRDTSDRLIAVGSRDRDVACRAADEFGADRAGSYDDVLANPEVEAVYIALPNSMHVEWTVRAAQAGKHILCEKPLAPTPAECERVVAAGASRGVHLVEAFMYRYHPRWQAVWRAIEADRIGPIRLLRATFGYSMGVDRATDIRLNPSLAGGAIQDVGCYCVNVARWFLGEPDDVRGFAIDRRDAGVDTHSAAVTRHGDAMAELACTFDGPLGQSVEIIGERGRIDIPIAFVVRGEAGLTITDQSGEHRETFAPVNQYGLEIKAFHALVRFDTPSLTPGSDAIATQRVIAAWQASQ